MATERANQAAASTPGQAPAEADAAQELSKQVEQLVAEVASVNAQVERALAGTGPEPDLLAAMKADEALIAKLEGEGAASGTSEAQPVPSEELADPSGPASDAAALAVDEAAPQEVAASSDAGPAVIDTMDDLLDAIAELRGPAADPAAAMVTDEPAPAASVQSEDAAPQIVVEDDATSQATPEGAVALAEEVMTASTAEDAAAQASEVAAQAIVDEALPDVGATETAASANEPQQSADSVSEDLVAASVEGGAQPSDDDSVAAQAEVGVEAIAEAAGANSTDAALGEAIVAEAAATADGDGVPAQAKVAEAPQEVETNAEQEPQTIATLDAALADAADAQLQVEEAQGVATPAATIEPEATAATHEEPPAPVASAIPAITASTIAVPAPLSTPGPRVIGEEMAARASDAAGASGLEMAPAAVASAVQAAKPSSQEKPSVEAKPKADRSEQAKRVLASLVARVQGGAKAVGTKAGPAFAKVEGPAARLLAKAHGPLIRKPQSLRDAAGMLALHSFVLGCALWFYAAVWRSPHSASAVETFDFAKAGLPQPDHEPGHQDDHADEHAKGDAGGGGGHGEAKKDDKPGKPLLADPKKFLVNDEISTRAKAAKEGKKESKGH